MAQYIDKYAVVAEIKKKLDKHNKLQSFNYGAVKDLESLLNFLDTIEVKEVDLEKEIKQDVTTTHDTLSTELETFDQIDEEKHWQDIRERAAIAAMQSIMNFFGSLDYNKETIAKLAVEQADALIEKLKKK